MFAQKNLVAAAALLAIAGAAQAQVKVYGTVDIGFGSFEAAHAANSSTRTTAVAGGNMMTSYLEQSTNMFVEMQNQMQTRTKNLFSGFPFQPYTPPSSDKDPKN